MSEREGWGDRAVRLINEMNVFPGERARRASDLGDRFLVVLYCDETGKTRQTEWKLPRLYNRAHRNAPRGAKYIGRGTPHGNPFKIGAHGNRTQVCEAYEAEVLPHLDLEPLRGEDLVCHCVPERCHGHSILARLYGGTWEEWWRRGSEE